MSSSQAPKKSNHRVNIVRVRDIKTHTNADTLEIIVIDGYQVVSKKGQFNTGDLAVYIQPDSVVPQTEPFRFIWEPYAAYETVECNGVDAPLTNALPVSERRRRITVRKFRGEWSEGLLLPVTDFTELWDGTHLKLAPEVTDVSDILGITHYDPEAGVEGTRGNNEHAPRRRYPKTLKGWFFFALHKLGFRRFRALTEEVSFDLPVYDVDAFKNHPNAFSKMRQQFTAGTGYVMVTEKIHGSNGRFVCIDGKMYAGSRNFWKAPTSNCAWRKALKQLPWIEEWCRAHEGYALYGEVVPTQKGFNYGCKEGEVKFFVFDIRTPEGEWVSWKASWADTYDMVWGLTLVPVLYSGPFALDHIKTFVDGPSQVAGAKHVREGIVIKAQDEQSVPGVGRLILKIVSNSFLEKDSKV